MRLFPIFMNIVAAFLGPEVVATHPKAPPEAIYSGRPKLKTPQFFFKKNLASPTVKSRCGSRAGGGACGVLRTAITSPVAGLPTAKCSLSVLREESPCPAHRTGHSFRRRASRSGVELTCIVFF